MRKAWMVICLLILCGCVPASPHMEAVTALSVIAVPAEQGDVTESVFFRCDQAVRSAEVTALEDLQGEQLGTPAFHTASLEEVEDGLYMLCFYVNRMTGGTAYHFDGVWVQIETVSGQQELFIPGEHRLSAEAKDAFADWRDGAFLSDSGAFLPDMFLGEDDVMKRIETLDGRATVIADKTLPCPAEACGPLSLSIQTKAPYEAYSGNLRIIWERDGVEHSAIVPIIRSWHYRDEALDIENGR